MCYESGVIKFLFPILLGPGKLASCTVIVFSGFMAMCLQTPRNFSLPLKTP